MTPTFRKQLDKRRADLKTNDSLLSSDIHTLTIKLDMLKTQQISIRGAIAALDEVKTWLTEGTNGNLHHSDTGTKPHREP